MIGHLRSLCSDWAWPQGDLNLPRPMVTREGLPENETVVAGLINAQALAASSRR